MDKLQKYSQIIYTKTQKDCSNFSERLGVQIAQKQICNILKQHNLLKPEEKFLDIGCGGGQFAKSILDEFNCDVYGLTNNIEEADKAEQQGIHVIKAEMSDIPLADSFFSVVYYGHVLEHSLCPILTLMECRRILQKGGCLLVWGPIGRDFKGVNDGTIVYGCRDHLITPTEWQYKWLFKLTDFSLIEEYSIPYKILSWKDNAVKVILDVFNNLIKYGGLKITSKNTIGDAKLFILKKEPFSNRL